MGHDDGYDAGWGDYLDGDHDAVYRFHGNAEGFEWDGFQVVSPDQNSDWFGGFDRHPNVVENEEEVMLEYARQGGAQPEIVCGYCEQHHRSRDVRRAIHWFNSHDCATLQLAEARGIVLDHTPFPADRGAQAA